jgi:glutamate carboxypeptidase
MRNLLLKIATCLLLSLASTISMAAETMESRYRELLGNLVNINTETSNLVGLTKARELLIPQFESLGLVLTRHRLAQDGREVLSFEIPGAKPKIMLLGHLDTVFSLKGAFQELKEQPDRLSGPGVIDMKGGIVLMLNALFKLKQRGELDYVRVVLNDDEEIGSSYSKEKLRQLAQDIPYGLVFEPGLEDGAVVSSQSGVRWIKLTSEGKASHAGLEPEKGIDACLDIAIKVKKITDLAQPEKGLTINPGVITGGTKPNVVCDKASVTFDIRFRSLDDWLAISQSLKEIGARSDVYNSLLQRGVRTEVVQLAEMPLLSAHKTTELLGYLKIATTALGQPFNARPVGYGSDGNNLAETGMQLLVGLGPYGGGMHSEQEFMLISAYSQRLSLITQLIHQIIPSLKGTP